MQSHAIAKMSTLKILGARILGSWNIILISFDEILTKNSLRREDCAKDVYVGGLLAVATNLIANNIYCDRTTSFSGKQMKSLFKFML